MNKEMYDFEESLRRQERARTTIEKYSRQVRRFLPSGGPARPAA